MILEGVVTTRNDDGSVNVSPMGPVVEPAMQRIVLRPFRTSTTYRNLVRTGCGVLHVTDDVWLLAQAAIGQPDPMPRLASVRELLPRAAMRSPGADDACVGEQAVLADACRWYAFQVVHCDDAERATLTADVVNWGRLRDFFGFNRAKHAVLEAAILATRVHLLPADELAAALGRLRPLVEKTGGDQEHRAFALLADYIGERLADAARQG